MDPIHHASECTRRDFRAISLKGTCYHSILSIPFALERNSLTGIDSSCSSEFFCSLIFFTPFDTDYCARARPSPNKEPWRRIGSVSSRSPTCLHPRRKKARQPRNLDSRLTSTDPHPSLPTQTQLPHHQPPFRPRLQ